MKHYLLRTRGINNAYYPDKVDKYAFNENAPNDTLLMNDIDTKGVRYYLYLILQGQIVETGTIREYYKEADMYFAIYENRQIFETPINLPNWPSPCEGIIPLSEKEVHEIEHLINKN